MRLYLVNLVEMTMREPRAAARRILDLRLERQVIWLGFALVVSVSAALAWLTVAAMPEGGQAFMIDPSSSPMSLVLLQGGTLLLMSGAMSAGGQIFGGTGNFLDALTLAVWIELMLAGLQGVQLFLLLVAPPFSALLGIAGILAFFWVLTHFVAELHGFTHRGKVLAGIVGGFFLVGIVLLTVIGAPVPVAGA